MAPFTTWPRRRWAVASALAPVLAVLFALAAPDVPAASAVGWWLGLAVAASLAALVLASYVPAAGWRPDLGCTPCAAMSGVTTFAAAFAFATFGTEISAPLLATVASGFGLVQRLTQPETCDTRLGPVELEWSADEGEPEPGRSTAPPSTTPSPRP